MLTLSAFGKDYVWEMTKIFILKFKIVLMQEVYTENFQYIYFFDVVHIYDAIPFLVSKYQSLLRIPYDIRYFTMYSYKMP